MKLWERLIENANILCLVYCLRELGEPTGIFVPVQHVSEVGFPLAEQWCLPTDLRLSCSVSILFIIDPTTLSRRSDSQVCPRSPLGPGSSSYPVIYHLSTFCKCAWVLSHPPESILCPLLAFQHYQNTNAIFLRNIVVIIHLIVHDSAYKSKLTFYWLLPTLFHLEKFLLNVVSQIIVNIGSVIVKLSLLKKEAEAFWTYQPQYTDKKGKRKLED